MTFGRAKCGCNKAVFKDLAHAERVLARKQDLGRDPKMPNRAERCDQGQWHLVGAKKLPTGLDRSTKELIDVRDEGVCACCGAVLGEWFSRQHRVARGQGGSSDPVINSPANAVSLCGSATSVGCHLAAESRAQIMYDAGFWLHPGEDPRAVPLRHYVHGWVLLDMAGGWSPVPAPAGAR
jgi:hypothetical protein